MNTKDAMHLARLWRVGKMIGGNEDEVRDVLLARVEELEKALQEIVRTAATIPGDGCGGAMHPFAAQYLVSARAVDASRALMEK
jgi:hypothetical protein